MNPYAPPSSNETNDSAVRMKAEIQAHIISNPNSGPAAVFLAKHPKTFWSITGAVLFGGFFLMKWFLL